jgi:signal peptidase I
VYQNNIPVAEVPPAELSGIRTYPPARSFIAEWTVTIVLLLFAATTLVQAFVIPTGSMENTLLVGDHLLVDKLSYSPPGSAFKRLLPYNEVKRGDIIVFRYPLDIRQTFVKRAIGVPGDHIRFVNKRLILNGKPEDEPYVSYQADSADSYRDNFPTEPNTRLAEQAEEMLEGHVQNGELLVPPGSIFAMGDNRDASFDSRYWGFVPRENIIGKPLAVYWSYDATTEDLANPAIGLHHLIDLLQHFMVKTRWRRTFRLIRGYPLN